MPPASPAQEHDQPDAASLVRRAFQDPWLLLVGAWTLAYAGVAIFLTRHGSVMTPDSTDYAEVARSLVRGHGDTINRVLFHVGRFPDVRHPLEVHGVLTPLLLAPLFAAFGTQEVLIRVPGILFTASLGLCVFCVARRMAGTGAGLLAAALIFSRRDLLFLGIVCSDDVGEALLAVAALGAFTRACNVKSPRWFWIAGVIAAAAAMQKMPGLLLPGVFLIALLMDRDSRNAASLKRWIAAAIPTVIVGALYTLRNYRVWGRLGSPYVALEWYGRDDLAAYFADYNRLPKFSRFLAEKGTARVLELVQVQLATFGRSVLADPLVIAGIVSMLLLFRTNTTFARLTLVYSLSLVVLVCGLHHVDARYFSPLYPLASVWLAAAVLAGEVPIRRYWGAWASRERLHTAFAVALASFIGWSSYQCVLGTREVGALMREPKPCEDSISALNEYAREGDRVLASNPWLVSWSADRAAIPAPTNGPDAIRDVVARYRVTWLFTGGEVPGSQELTSMLELPELRHALRPSLVYDGETCDVYRLRPR